MQWQGRAASRPAVTQRLPDAQQRLPTFQIRTLPELAMTLTSPCQRLGLNGILDAHQIQRAAVLAFQTMTKQTLRTAGIPPMTP